MGSKSFTLGCEFAGQLVSDIISVDIRNLNSITLCGNLFPTESTSLSLHGGFWPRAAVKSLDTETNAKVQSFWSNRL